MPDAAPTPTETPTTPEPTAQQTPADSGGQPTPPAPSLIDGGGSAGDQAPPPSDSPPTPDSQDEPAPSLIPGAEPKPKGAWYEDLDIDEQYLTDAVKGMKSPADAVKSFVETQKLLGKRTVRRPGEDATPEQWAEYREAIGVPKDADGYEYEIPESMQEIFTPEGVASFREVALQNDMTPAQYKGVMKHYESMHSQSMQHLQDSQVAERLATEQALREEWGGDFDQRLDRVADAARRTGLGELLSELGVGNSRKAVEALDRIAGMLPDQNNPAPGSVSIETEIDALKRNPAYTDASHPGHNTLMKRYEELMRRKYMR